MLHSVSFSFENDGSLADKRSHTSQQEFKKKTFTNSKDIHLMSSNYLHRYLHKDSYLEQNQFTVDKIKSADSHTPARSNAAARIEVSYFCFNMRGYIAHEARVSTQFTHTTM